jgi:hypothetical protein
LAGAALRFDRRAARFGNDLIEPPVEPCQSLGDAIRRLLVMVAGASLGGNALELAGEIVETVVDRGEVVADRLLVVAVIAG